MKRKLPVPKFRTILFLASFCLLITACSKKAPDPVAEIPPELIEKALRDFTALWDLNEDGAATCADIAVLRERQFKRLDKDGDQTLDALEYRAINFEDTSFVFYEFSTLDTDQSGSLGLAELSAVSHNLFRSTDKNGDCAITYSDAAYIVLNNRRNGIGGRERPIGDAPKKRRESGQVDPF